MNLFVNSLGCTCRGKQKFLLGKRKESKVKTFRVATSPGSTQMTFGDLDPNGIAGLNGDIQMVLFYKGWHMDELIIKAHHKMICERYGVDHSRISFP